MSESTQQQALDQETQKNIDLWLKSPIEKNVKEEIRQLLENHPKQAIDAFYQRLHFGTGGIRGIMGWGTNRMNIYTVRMATQGLANYILRQKEVKNPSVAISYDSREHSLEFAEEAAKVFAANGIQARLFEQMRPVALLSFAVRYHECIAGIMVTASHNPAQYNGYKVYWEDGAQVLPPHDKGIIEEVEKIEDFSQIKHTEELSHPLIHWMSGEVDEAYRQAILPLQNYPADNQKHGNELSIIYTSLHGTGITVIPKVLEEWGFTRVICPKEQNTPNGLFPTAPYPNPEIRQALEVGIHEMLTHSADILVATDPDADRMGIAFRHNGDVEILDGNQILCICLAHVCQALSTQKRLPENAAFVKTIVTSELFRAICSLYQRPCFDVLTGFKYIAQKIREWERDPQGYQYIFGGEESYGSLLGTHARDKDAVVASALICEIALHAKRQGKTLLHLLHELYSHFGVHIEELENIQFPETRAGQEKMQRVMERLRSHPIRRILNREVLCIEDYLLSKRQFLLTGKEEKIIIPSSNVLVFWLDDKTKLVVRPSGTEPKVKVYCGVVHPSVNSLSKEIRAAERQARQYLAAFKEHLDTVE